MRKTIVELKNASVVINNGFESKTILDGVSLEIKEGDFITLLGGNGAGKSTLFNVIAGNLMLTSGRILIDGKDVTKLSSQARAKYIARVFQDPKMGTAPRMTVAENLAVAALRGKSRGLALRDIASQRQAFEAIASRIGNGLETHYDTPTGSLSGGQRQALSLVMATLTHPEILLLDEHTAALDPKTSVSIMSLTDELVKESQLTTLMVTHHMEDALTYGNRLLVMKQGEIIQDLASEEKAKMKLSDFYQLFE
jgi:putative ABC transport system ATP-binding protein